MTLLAAPLWIAGLWFSLFSREGERFRLLGWMYVVPLLLFVAAKGRGYYLQPAYPMLYAAGAVWGERRLQALSPAWKNVGRTAAWLALAADVVLVSALFLPIAPIGSRWFHWASGINGDLREEIGWPELVREVARIRDSLAEQDRAHLGILGTNYGEAGAVNLYGTEYGLPRAIGRALRLDDEAERKLLAVAEQPLQDIIVLMRDTGMRNGRELYRMRIEHIDWNNRVIFNPSSKTKKGRRFIPMSDRVLDILLVRCAGRKEGWVFPSRHKGKHITGGLVNKQWVKARTKAGLPEGLVLYCARHDFGTYVLQKTGNIAAVMNTMGHSDVKTAMVYQHPELNLVREAINARSLAGNSGHILGHRSERPN